MIDRKTVRDKVVKELESLRGICNAKSNMAIGNGKVAWAGYANVADDALALLKDQEPLPVSEGKLNECTCGHEINRYWHPKFCGFCGKELIWY